MPADEHHEHSGRPQPALQREAMFCHFLSGLRKPPWARIISISGFGGPQRARIIIISGVRRTPKGVHHQHQRGLLCIYLRCPPVGAAPRIKPWHIYTSSTTSSAVRVRTFLAGFPAFRLAIAFPSWKHSDLPRVSWVPRVTSHPIYV